MDNNNHQGQDSCPTTSGPGPKAAQSNQTAGPGRGLKPGQETPMSNDVREQLSNHV